MTLETSVTGPQSHQGVDFDRAETESSLSRPVRPIIVVSAGRSGSTIFHDLFTHHPDTCWMPSGCGNRPTNLGRYRLLFRAVQIPGVGELLRRRFQPVEGYEFWERHCPGFSRTCRDLRATDLTPVSRDSTRAALRDLITKHRSRLILKITGWPRAGFLKELFPHARFIHLVRDGRSVAASLLQVPWWRGWEGPDNWRFGSLSPAEQHIWEKHDHSFVALAGLQWNKIMDAMEFSRSEFESEGTWLTVRYEDLCREPDRIFEEVLEFSELTSDASFLDYVRNFGLKSRNPKWRKHLSSQQQVTLEEVVSHKLEEFGYQ